MLNSVQIVLMLMSMFSYISEDKRTVVLFLLELIVSYNPDLGRFPITRQTYETVCELYEPLSALGAYRQVLLDSKSKPTVMGAHALLRAILMPILDGLSSVELEELKLSAEDGASVLSLPLTMLQAKVKRWTRQARKDHHWIWSAEYEPGLLSLLGPTPIIAGTSEVPESTASDWTSNIKMGDRLALAVLEYYREFTEVDYVAAPAKTGLKRRGHVKKRKIDTSTSAHRFDDICNYGVSDPCHRIDDLHKQTIGNAHNHTNNTTDHHINNHHIDFKDIPEAWWTAPTLSAAGQSGHFDTPYSCVELPATPLKRAASVPTFEDIQDTSINAYYSMELPETPLKRATSTPTFEQISGDIGYIDSPYYPPPTPLKHAASVPTFGDMDTLGDAAMELPETPLKRAASVPTFEEFDIFAPISNTYPPMEPPPTPLKRAASVPTFEDITLPGGALGTTMHGSCYSMELPPTPLKRATSVPTFQDIAYPPIGGSSYGDTPTTSNTSQIDFNFVSPATLPYGWDQQDLDLSNYHSIPSTPLKRITSGPIVESPSGYDSEELEYPTLVEGTWDQSADLDITNPDSSRLPETSLESNTSNGFDYGMWEMVTIPAPETAPAPTSSKDASGLWDAPIGLPPHTPLRRRNGVRNLRAAAASENVFLAEPSPTTAGRPYSLNAIVDSDSDSDDGDDGDESMDLGTAAWLARGPAQISLDREVRWACRRAQAGLGEPTTPTRALTSPPKDVCLEYSSSLRDSSSNYGSQSAISNWDRSDEEDQRSDLGSDANANIRWIFPRVETSVQSPKLEVATTFDDNPELEQESALMLSPRARTPSFAYTGSSRGTSPTPTSVQTPRTSNEGLFDSWAAEWERGQHLRWTSALGDEQDDEDEATQNAEPSKKGRFASFCGRLGALFFAH